MPTFHAYPVSATAVFHATDYPEITADLAALAKAIEFMPGYGKVQATVSFLKNHSINTQLVAANPVLVDMIRFGALNISRIELLFESCHHNPAFRRDLETYVRDGLERPSNLK